MARFINRRIREHIEASIRNNPIKFSEIDQSPRNGLVTWDEYFTYFLKSLGYDDAFIRQVDRSRSSNLDRKTKELLMREKALWNEAARTDSYSLTLDEFLSFRHPGKNETTQFDLESIHFLCDKKKYQIQMFPSLNQNQVLQIY